MNGVVIAGDSLLRVATNVFVATLGFAGSFLALRFTKASYVSFLRALMVVVIYAICTFRLCSLKPSQFKSTRRVI
jgi:hypothetical protein